MGEAPGGNNPGERTGVSGGMPNRLPDSTPHRSAKRFERSRSACCEQDFPKLIGISYLEQPFADFGGHRAETGFEQFANRGAEGREATSFQAFLPPFFQAFFQTFLPPFQLPFFPCQLYARFVHGRDPPR